MSESVAKPQPDILFNPSSPLGDRTNPGYTHELSRSRDARIADLEDDIRSRVPFKGTWNTFVTRDRQLVVPKAYQSLLAYGGVVTVGVDENITVFGRTHWERFQQILSREFSGLSPEKNAVIRHIYAHAYEFDKLEEPLGSIKLSKELIKYAKIKRDVTVVGLVYFAEVHASEDDHDIKLNSQDIKKLAGAIKWRN